MIMRSTRLRLGVAVLALVLGTQFAGATVADAQTNPFERGPAPTLASLNAAQGPFAIAQTTVARQSNFGGGTIYYPTDTSQGTFGAIAVSPGFFSAQSAIAWTGPRLASRGFVVFTISTLSIFDFPSSRASQLQAALNYLTQTSSVRSRIDASRLGVMGHSMGGGGSLEAARANPALQAAVPLQPWDSGQNFSTVRVPTLIVGAQNDSVAPVAQHSEPFYTQIPAASEKAYLEVAGASHSLGTTAETTQARLAVVWMKRYIDNDIRYEQFMCPAPTGSTINEYRNTCPG
jgi:dienelactone hydrolase